MADSKHAECCDFMHIHEEIVNKVRAEMPGDESLYALFESEMCVCDIAGLLDMTQSAISHQLKVLKQSKLVSSRRDGKTVFYTLADAHVRTIIDQGLEHISE